MYLNAERARNDVGCGVLTRRSGVAVTDDPLEPASETKIQLVRGKINISRVHEF
jgi:hypothetical protein